MKNLIKKVTAKVATKKVALEKAALAVCNNCNGSGMTCSVCKAGRDN